MPSMRKLMILAMFLLVSCVLALIGLELVANGLYYSKHRRIYYTDERKPAQAGAYTAAEAVFHPYYSFIHRVGRSGGWWTTNNLGFQVLTSLVESDPGCCDIPLARKNDEVIVGVFGGSVAGGFSLAAQKAPEFASRLARIPGWAGKKVRILNFGMPGFKQPQQLNALAYALTLGQHFDLVLNIDGFNEVVTSHRNWAAGAEPSFPSDELWGAWGRQVERLGNPGQPDAGDRYLAAYYESAAVEWRKRAERCTFATCHIVSQLAAGLAKRRAGTLTRESRAMADKQSLFPTAIRPHTPPGFEIHRSTAEQWAAASRAMAAMTQASGGHYLHVLQPNQWWTKPAGTYPPIEREHIYKWVVPLIEQGYPLLAERMTLLAHSGVQVYDASAVFRGAAWRDVYVDDCCHYTDKGNALLATAIAERVAKALAARRAPAGG